MSNQAIICDLDAVIQQPRIVKITENKARITGLWGWILSLIPSLRHLTVPQTREINVTDIPSGLLIEMMSKESRLTTLLDAADDAAFDYVLDLAVRICQVSCPDIDAAWVKANVSTMSKLKQFMEFVLEPLSEYLTQTVDAAAKNLLADKTALPGAHQTS